MISTGKFSVAVRPRRRWLVHQRAKVEGAFGRPADQRVLHRRPYRVPRPAAVPIIDKAGDGGAIVTAHHSFAKAPGDITDLGIGLSARSAHLPQQMERRWLVERHAGDPEGTGQRRVQRDTTAVRMADEMNLSLAVVDQRDGRAASSARANA